MLQFMVKDISLKVARYYLIQESHLFALMTRARNEPLATQTNLHPGDNGGVPRDQLMNKLSLIIAGVLLLGGPSQMLLAQSDTTEDRIRVTGEGFIDAVPDLAMLRASISAIAPAIEEAKRDVDRRYEAGVEALTTAGVPEEDIEGATVRVQKEYEWSDNKRLYKGEKMTRFLNVKVRDTSIYGEVLQALVDAGISSVDQTTMGFSDENSLRQKALGIAADNAKSNAAFLATRLGRTLGKVVRITDQSGPMPGPVAAQPRMMMAEAAQDGGAPPREMFGTRRVNANIVVEFELN
jgi:uncharacterized protein YggE